MVPTDLPFYLGKLYVVEWNARLAPPVKFTTKTVQIVNRKATFGQLTHPSVCVGLKYEPQRYVDKL